MIAALIRLQLRTRAVQLAWLLMSKTAHCWGSCANRVYRSTRVGHFTATLELRNDTKPGGYSWEEIYRVLQTAYGRPLTPEEWRFVTDRMTAKEHPVQTSEVKPCE